MTALLQYTNPYGERYYLAELGDTWPHQPGVRFVQRTVLRADAAMQFASEREAAECLTHKMRGGAGWEVVTI